MCDCNKKFKINNIEQFNEDFSLEKPKDMCHYTCSEINATNIVIFFLVIILIYLMVKK